MYPVLLKIKCFYHFIHSLQIENHCGFLKKCECRSIPHRMLFASKYHSLVPFSAEKQINRHVKFNALHPQQPTPPLKITVLISKFHKRTSNKCVDFEWALTQELDFPKMNM